MSGLDIEALLDSTVPETNGKHEDDDRHQSDRADRRDRDSYRESSRDRDRDRKRRDRSRDHRKDRHEEDLKSPRSDKGSVTESHKSRRRSRSREDEKKSKRERDEHRSSGGDYYRNGRRSRSPDDRYYRPRDSHRSKRDHDQDAPRNRRRSRSRDRRSKTPEVQLTEDERDRRTVFVQQLAARLRTKELIHFFEKIGPVKEAQIVKDRVSGRSKGYVLVLLVDHLLILPVSAMLSSETNHLYHKLFN